MKKTWTILVTGLTFLTAMMAVLLIYTRQNVDRILFESNGQTYEYRYVMISDDTSDQWQAIFDAAKEKAGETGVYLEWIGKDLPVNYGPADHMRIAIANQADGIILHLRSGERVTELIDEAAEQGIPVITVLEDDPESCRVSFIGINSYQMGEIYGKQILKNLDAEHTNVGILQSSALKSSSASLMNSQMRKVVDAGRSDSQTVEFTTYEIDISTSFDAEEDIRDIFLKTEELPDVLICTDMISTECVLQALVDYNEVGNVRVLGYYASDKVKEGIRKGLLEATMLLDTKEMGRLCVEALNEYRQLGHVSNYYNAGIQMITIRTLLREAYQRSLEYYEQ